jgi:uncharacterized membrane protein
MRYWEIDFLRGIAVVLMIAYHFAFDLIYFKTYNNLYWLAVPIASLFIMVSGVSLSISYSRGGRFLKFARRGIKLLFLGLVITAVTFILLREGFIFFGILHFFGVTSFLVYPLLKYLKGNLSYLFLGIFIILTGSFLELRPVNFYSFDYFPLIPWFGVLLIGIFLGKTFYPKGKRNFKIFKLKGRIIDFTTFFGRNSLIIYFIHQPIIFLILFLLGHGEFLSAFNL